MPGRPQTVPGGFTELLPNVRISPDMYAMLGQASSLTGLTLAEITRTCITYAFGPSEDDESTKLIIKTLRNIGRIENE